jgi:FtsP/CotA-like multicopper oxidase with cupredoxin domain
MLALLSAVALTAVGHAPPPTACTNLPTPPANAAAANDNRARAGRLENGVLTLRLVARPAAWRPDGPSGCALSVHAFAEEGKGTTIPGPLIRVQSGTEVRVIVRNALPGVMWVRGLQDRAMGSTLDSAEVEPGASREFRFVAATRGAWHYWAGAVGARSPTSDVNGQLVGGLVVDSTSNEASREDRVMVLTRWNPPARRTTRAFS